ncbi:hypothetical protein [Lentilactobacillus senioris]|uniref:hypothetical protein n=1 Tax=Lentilactobacillus senioris TaxID=931534 RepID=UPI0006D18931|nr:hypothetical protein [Lentilactobacillus senioris]
MKKTLLRTIATVAISISFNASAHAATLHVHQSSIGSWKMECDVVTSGKSLKQIKNLEIKSSIWSITNKKIYYLSKNTANIKFTRHLASLAYHENISIKFKGGKLLVTH